MQKKTYLKEVLKHAFHTHTTRSPKIGSRIPLDMVLGSELLITTRERQVLSSRFALFTIYYTPVRNLPTLTAWKTKFHQAQIHTNTNNPLPSKRLENMTTFGEVVWCPQSMSYIEMPQFILQQMVMLFKEAPWLTKRKLKDLKCNSTSFCQQSSVKLILFFLLIGLKSKKVLVTESIFLQ